VSRRRRRSSRSATVEKFALSSCVLRFAHRSSDRQRRDSDARSAKTGPLSSETYHSKQPIVGSLQSAQQVIIHCHAIDTAVPGQHPRLRFDQLRRQDAVHGAEQCVAAHQVEVPTQLFDAVRLATTEPESCSIAKSPQTAAVGLQLLIDSVMLSRRSASRVPAARDLHQILGGHRTNASGLSAFASCVIASALISDPLTTTATAAV
jgi:hypothetical protein